MIHFMFRIIRSSLVCCLTVALWPCSYMSATEPLVADVGYCAPALSARADNGGIAQKLIGSENFLHVYRLAMPVTYSSYQRDFGGSEERVRVWWQSTVESLNEVFARDLGVYFVLVDNPRLIMDESSSPNTSNSITIVNQSTSIINDLIGEDSYDVGLMIADVSDVNGRGYVKGAYMKRYKGGSVARPIFVAIVHELGHMFGSLHVQANNTTSYFSEPGAGQSVMGYGDKLPFFSSVSAAMIRSIRNSGYMSVLNYPERTDTIHWSGLEWTSYDNLVGAVLSENRPPQIDTLNLKRHYRIPAGSYMKFEISASDPDGDALLYSVQQVDVASGPEDCRAVFRPYAPAGNPVVAFKPSYRLEWIDGADKLVENDYSGRVSTPGEYTMLLSVSDGGKSDESFLYDPHAVCYDAYETTLELVSGDPFEITSVTPSTSWGTYSYNMGQRLTLNWNSCSDVFGYDSRVRISLSDDFGETFKYILKESAPNTGSCQVILPHVAIGQVNYAGTGIMPRAGVIMIEVIGSIACDYTAVVPFTDRGSSQISTGGFKVVASTVSFTGVPERYVTVSDGELPPVADVKAYAGGRSLEVRFTESGDDYSVSRVWEATDPNGKTSAFEQIIVLEDEGECVSMTAVSDGRQNVYAGPSYGGIVVAGADGLRCSVYGIAGNLILTEDISSDSAYIKLDSGIYIVKVAERVYKIKVM